MHALNHTWTLWSHLPHDIDWTIDSYKEIYTFSTLEEAMELFEFLPPSLIENCMLFLMKKDIQPLYEDPQNRDGGVFSFKVMNTNVYPAWKALSYLLIGETVSVKDTMFTESVTGISIAPKKNFCIIKIWLANSNHTNVKVVSSELSGLFSFESCPFKKHF